MDLSDNVFFFRRDVREDRAGTELKLKMRIVGTDNCLPMPNARVNIWHCDKDGNYSGYSTEAGKTYLRGYQIADANGEVEFTTIFPGWYPGRVCHIHFQVFVSTAYSAVSQLAFPGDTTNQVYTENTAQYTKGADPLQVEQDNVFADGYALQMATLEKDVANNRYNSFIEVAVKGAGTTGVGHLEKEAQKYFRLGQNIPNPALAETSIPFTLHQPAMVKLELFDLSGKVVTTLLNATLNAADYNIPVASDALRLATSSLAYQLTVSNASGTYSDVRLLTIKR